MTRPGRRPAPLLAAALTTAARGWPVFPLYPGSKRPALKGWETAASCDPDTITAWWARAPYNNIGIACGPAGLLVLDLDGPGQPPPEWAARGVQNGRDVLAVLAHRADAEDPTGTHTVATPAGEHRYFTTDPDKPGRCTVGRLGWHIDTRGPGGFVVAAGSTRTVAGQRRHYRTTDAAAPVAAPDWLIDLLTPPATQTTGAPAVPAVPVHRTGAYAAAALRAEAATVRGARTGTRNALLFRAAARLGELVAAGLLDEDLVTGTLQAAATGHHGTEEFTAQEAERAIGNGLARGQQHPRAITTLAG